MFNLRLVIKQDQAGVSIVYEYNVAELVEIRIAC
jgi:hypothetical protein